MPASVKALADFFEVNLPGRNFVVDSSEGGETQWDIAFSGDSGTGTVSIKFGSQEVSEAVVRLTAAG